MTIAMSLLVAALYVIAYCLVLFINKYVLSILKFTYPAIFQGWQTFCGIVVMHILNFGKIIDISLHSIAISEVKIMIPSMVLYTFEIVTGSKALATLPIPVFLGLHSSIIVSDCLVKSSYSISWLKFILSCAQIIILLLCYYMIITTSLILDHRSFYWMTTHVICHGFNKIYDSNTQSICWTSVQKRYCSYLCAVILLAPLTMILGEFSAAPSFRFLTHYRFYASCAASGLFGCALFLLQSQCGIRLEAEGVAKIFTVFISFYIFDDSVSNECWFWIGLSLVTSLLPIHNPDKSNMINSCRDKDMTV